MIIIYCDGIVLCIVLCIVVISHFVLLTVVNLKVLVTLLDITLDLTVELLLLFQGDSGTLATRQGRVEPKKVGHRVGVDGGGGFGLLCSYAFS